MPEQLPSVWYDRDYPVLLEVARRMDSGEHTPRVGDVAETLGMSVEDVGLAGLALERTGFLETLGAMGNQVLRFKNLKASAYSTTGLHPDSRDATTALVEALSAAANQHGEGKERTLLRRAADAIKGLPASVAQGVLTAYLTGQLPGH